MGTAASSKGFDDAEPNLGSKQEKSRLQGDWGSDSRRETHLRAVPCEISA
jgi:hypothetical protein